MEFSLKQMALVFLVLVASISITRYCTPEKIRYSTGAMQEELDSLTTLSRSLYLTKDQLQDSLEGTSQAFQDYIDKTKDEIASYSRITGKLRLTIDSLENVAGSASLVDLINNDTTSSYQFRDTTLFSRSFWGDSLFKSEARAGIKNDSLFLDPPDLTQIRKIRIDVATTISKDRSQINTLVTSRDFEDLRVDSFTPMERKKRFPWTEIVAVASFILGIVVGG